MLLAERAEIFLVCTNVPSFVTFWGILVATQMKSIKIVKKIVGARKQFGGNCFVSLPSYVPAKCCANLYLAGVRCLACFAYSLLNVSYCT